VPVAPFEVAVINLKAGDADTDKACADLYGKLGAAGIDVLLDDTDERAGAKFSTMELIGVPYSLVVGPKGVKAGEVEVKHRKTGEKETLSPEAAVKRVVDLVQGQRVLV
jgi:prolyl-tRNA synthetase